MSTLRKTGVATKNLAVDEQKYEQFVRFANGTDSPKPELQRLNEPIPEGVRYGSPIYYLNTQQAQYHDSYPEPYAVEEHSIAKQLQDVAESEATVHYPVYIESDAPVNLDTQVDWLKQFCEEVLNTAPEACQWYYSGGRSIHVHAPKLATEKSIDTLRDLAIDFEHDIDYQIYSRKRWFRLPGTIHEDNQLPKVKIDPDWCHDRIFREGATADPERPDTFGDLLTDTFGSDVLQHPERYLWQPQKDSEPVQYPVNDWEQYEPVRGRLHEKWKAHYSHALSPYAHSGEGSKSLVIGQIQDGCFSEKRETWQEGKDKLDVFNYLPTYVYQFWGCNRQFTSSEEHRPVKLSKTDYEKLADMDIGEGDCYALIGGQSRNSRILSLTRTLARGIAGQDSYDDAITLLEEFGYDTGSSGKVESNFEVNVYDQTEGFDGENTEAYELQSTAEQEGIENLSHTEQVKVANRLIQQYGRADAMQWFSEQYGEQFNPEQARNQIEHICESFDDLPEPGLNNTAQRSEI